VSLRLSKNFHHYPACNDSSIRIEIQNFLQRSVETRIYAAQDTMGLDAPQMLA
jgi:hypothetical protein